MPRNPRADQIGTGGRIKSESPGGCARNAQDISVAQVARRYAMNATLIFKWLRDPRFAPEPEVATEGMDAPCFLPVEIVGQAHDEGHLWRVMQIQSLA